MYLVAKGSVIAAFATCVAAASNPQGSFNCVQSLCQFVPASPSTEAGTEKWSGFENLIVFGASYAYAGPDILNPEPPYKTSCNGPNYIDYLSNGLNQSVINTKEYAVPGSPVSWSALDKDEPTTWTDNFVGQADSYIKDFKAGFFQGWSAANTLYHTEFGINDINVADAKYPSLEPAIFEQYKSTLETLYQSGARNFLILDVPPIDRSPAAADAGQQQTQLWKNSVISFNTQVSDMIMSLGNQYTDAVFFRLGLNGLFSKVLDDTSSSNFTTVYKDTTHNCTAYVSSSSNDDSLPSKDYKSPNCPYAVNEYFWLQGYHPTYPMHNLMASEIAVGLQKL